MPGRRISRSKVLIPSVIVAVAAVLIAFIVVNGSRDEPPPVATDSEAFPHDIGIERRDALDPLAFGRVDAPVTMVVFSDYQCPYCAQWSRDALPALMKRVEAGQLRIEMRDISVFGEASRRAAEAAYAAAKQNRYLQFHDALFPDGEKRAPGELTRDALIDTAADVGLDVAAFTADMTSNSTRTAVDRSEYDAATVGAFSTPSFILGGQPLAGAGPASRYLDKLDALLSDG